MTQGFVSNSQQQSAGISAGSAPELLVICKLHASYKTFAPVELEIEWQPSWKIFAKNTNFLHLRKFDTRVETLSPELQLSFD